MLVLDWDERTVEHIWRHRVIPEEVEEAVADSILRFNYRGRLIVWGRTAAGRYLFAALIRRGNRRWYVVTARDMTTAERRRAGRHRRR